MTATVQIGPNIKDTSVEPNSAGQTENPTMDLFKRQLQEQGVVKKSVGRTVVHRVSEPPFIQPDERNVTR